MRKIITILLILCAQTFVCAQSVYNDTLLTYKDSLSLLTDTILSASESLERVLRLQLDSIHRARVLAEPTTADPFHVGYADSLRIDSAARAFPYHILAIPMPFVPLNCSSQQLVEPDSVTNFNEWKFYRGVRRFMTTRHADLYNGVYDPTLFADPETVTADMPVNYFEEKALIKDEVEDREHLKRIAKYRGSPWSKQATVMLQLSQNYVSPNWYAGGNSNFALIAIMQGFINYKSDKLTWENSGEWRAGANTVIGDSLRKVNMNDDLLKLYTKFGYKIYDKLYYSMSGEFQTHLFNTWTDNSRELKTGTFTPIRLNIAVGLDYKPVKGLSIVFSPLAYKMVYAMDTVRSTPTSYSIPEGCNILNEAGSSMRVEWLYKPLREIELETKFYLYTNYKKVEIDLEVNCNFVINRYFSARVTLHPRYDNTVILSGAERAKIQFKELVSVGFSHKFR